MHTYTNPFHSAHYTGSRPEITTTTTPKEYKGFQIFKISDKHFDVVKDGVLVSQMAGPNGAMQAIDKLEANQAITKGAQMVRI